MDKSNEKLKNTE
jgi:hypothetical protein